MVFTEDLRDIRLNEDGQLVMFAIVAKGTDNSEIPRPDDSYLREYLGLPQEQQPLGQDDGGETGPILPQTQEPFETDEPAGQVPESSEPNDD